jgi:hypothetical protein
MEQNKNLQVIKKLPTLTELTSENLPEASDIEALNYYLNQPPPEKWIKEHPTITGYKYLPIDKIEYMLRRIFKRYRIEVTGQGVSFNGVWVTVRVHYWNIATSEWDYHDGIGAEQLQTKKGTSAADLINVNHGAVSMAFPKAKTAAVKDACDHFGNLFGANLNRKDTLNFSIDAGLVDAEPQKLDPEIQESIDLITDIQGLDKYIWQVTNADKKLNQNMLFRNAIEKKRKELTPKN